MSTDGDRLLDSLEVLERSLHANEQRPLVVEMVTQSVREIDGAGVQVRCHEAQALHREGMTMDGIARLFGVSRQRVSALLRDRETASR